MLHLFLLIIAIIIVLIEIYSARVNKKVSLTTNSDRWLLCYRWRWLIGIPFAVASAFIYYPLSSDTATYKIFGFPLLVAAFDQAGRDYISVFTIPFFIANAMIWFFFPHLILRIWAYFSAAKLRC